jgi:hypothetical protein
MALQHLAFPAAVHADHVIAVHGSPGRDRWSSLGDGFRRRFTELTERPMDGRDQGRKLIGGDLIVSEIAANNPPCEL